MLTKISTFFQMTGIGFQMKGIDVRDCLFSVDGLTKAGFSLNLNK